MNFHRILKELLKIDDLAIKTGKPEVHEKIIEVEPDMSQIGPMFKKMPEKS